MTTDGHWVGDIGHLALADAMLSVSLIDMLKVLAHATYPERPREVRTDLTTGQAARDITKRLDNEPDLFPGQMSGWLADVLDAADLRNQVLHAVALDRCSQCGDATQFVHPKTGLDVDRSDESVQALTSSILALNQLGMPIAEEIASRVNARIIDRARIDAEATGEIQNPPQIYPERVTRACPSCGGGITAKVGPTVAVLPREQMQALMDRLGAKPRRWKS